MANYRAMVKTLQRNARERERLRSHFVARFPLVEERRPQPGTYTDYTVKVIAPTTAPRGAEQE